MNDDSNARLDELLSLWHWLRSYGNITEGTPGQAAGCSDAVTSRQYDDANGALDAAVEQIQAEAVDVAVRAQEEPYRTAMFELARNLYTGHAVWFSPRLPEDKTERQAIVTEGRRRLIKRFKSDGLIPSF